jgi:hypothetical protein
MPEPAGDQVAEAYPVPPAPPGGGDRTPRRRRLFGRGKVWLGAGVAAGFFLVGGVGGFVAGHAAAGDGRDFAPSGQHGPRDGFGQGQPGQLPGVPSFPDHGDDDGPSNGSDS